MANKKFSEFTVKTSTSDVDFVVGYDGTDNVRITPANLTGGGGASSLNGLSDVLIDGTSSYLVNIPSGLSGNPANNTILGNDAGESLTNGNNNTLLGSYAARLGNASNNVAIGIESYRSLNGDSNVAVGAYSGYLATNSNGVYVGRESGRSNTSTAHISIGYQAGYSNTSGTTNTNLGYQAGYNNTTGLDRVTIGYEAGKNQTGSYNVFVGPRCGKGSGTGIGNVAIGQGVMEASAAASNCVFIGNYMAANVTSGAASTVAIGYNCLSNSGYSGEDNTIVGGQAGNNLTSGDKNTLIGRQAGNALTSSPDNTFIGYQAGLNFNNTGGDGRNVAVGSNAGNDLTTGIYNTFLGYEAGGFNTNITTGNFNVMVGYQAAGSGASASNQNSFGYSAASTGNNQVTLGNSSISTLRCAVTSITSLSDERDKSEIKDLEYGLAFIDALQPREFVWNNRPETDAEGEEFFSSNKGKKDFGFIAQEVKELDNDTLRLVYDENPEKLELSYGKLVPVLVQAIKELKAEIELLKS